MLYLFAGAYPESKLGQIFGAIDTLIGVVIILAFVAVMIALAFGWG